MANSKSNIKKALGELAKLAGGDVAGDRGGGGAIININEGELGGSGRGATDKQV